MENDFPMGFNPIPWCCWAIQMKDENIYHIMLIYFISIQVGKYLSSVPCIVASFDFFIEMSM